MLKAALPTLRLLSSEWLQDCNSVLASAIFHLTALVVLGLLTITAPGKAGDGELLVEVGPGYEGPAGGGPLGDEVGQFSVAADDVDAALAAGPKQVFDVAQGNVSDLGTIESPLDSLQIGSGLGGISIGDGGGLGGGGGGGDGSDGSGGAQFFGIGGQGGTFVYVVDISGSMNENGKWERAQDELLRSISHLDEGQKYYIIFYNDGWYPMDTEKPIVATARHVDKTRRWVGRIWPSGGTFPLKALLQALSLEPDAIYFLSDGRFDPAVIEAVRVQNPDSTGQIPIHTIAFVNQETIGIMQMIAKNSGGKFRFVE